MEEENYNNVREQLTTHVEHVNNNSDNNIENV